MFSFPWCSLFLLCWPGYSSLFREVLSWAGKRKNMGFHSSSVRLKWKTKNKKDFGFPENYKHFWYVKIIKNSKSGNQSQASSVDVYFLWSFKSLLLPCIFFFYDGERIVQKTTIEKDPLSLSAPVFWLWNSSTLSKGAVQRATVCSESTRIAKHSSPLLRKIIQ